MLVSYIGSYIMLVLSLFHRFEWWENLQETPIFDGKNYGFL